MRYFITFSMLLILAACQQKGFHPSDEHAIRDVIAQQQDGWNAGSIRDYMQGYKQSDSVRFISGGTLTFGWETVLERYESAYSNKELMGSLRFSDIHIEGLAPDKALAFGKWELQRNEDHPWGLFTLLFEKSGNSWRIVHDHTSLAK